MPNPMEKPMDKSNPMAAVERTLATREALRPKLEAAGLIPANDEKTEALAVPSTTEEHLRRMSKKKVIPRDAYGRGLYHDVRLKHDK